MTHLSQDPHCNSSLCNSVQRTSSILAQNYAAHYIKGINENIVMRAVIY